MMEVGTRGYYITNKAHLTTLNLNNFKMDEAMGLKILASRPA
jgi:hypothetical protein